MKTLLFSLSCLAIAASVAAPAFAAGASPACEAKRARIEAQIAAATARGQDRAVAGLKKALKENQAHCTDAALEKERKAEIKKAQRKVAEQEKSLDEAKRKGDAKKIADRQAKLDEARAALAEAEKPLAR